MANVHNIVMPVASTTADTIAHEGEPGIYYIEASGAPDKATQFVVMNNVYGKLFADPTKIPDTNDKVLTMIGDTTDAYRRQADYYPVNFIWRYEFFDAKLKSLRIPDGNLGKDTYLQVWVLFKGDSVYTPSKNGPVKFTPKA
jgi:hypothetical protein